MKNCDRGLENAEAGPERAAEIETKMLEEKNKVKDYRIKTLYINLKNGTMTDPRHSFPILL